jgi:hypothetical protein
MSDFQNDDPFRRDARLDPDARAANAAWGWVAAAIFLVVVLAVAFGVGHQPGQNGINTASNDAPPALTQMSHPSAMSPSAPAPSSTLGTPAAPITPAPSAPAQSNGGQ